MLRLMSALCFVAPMCVVSASLATAVQIEGRLVGGVVTREGEYPFVVTLSPTDEVNCTGSVIHEEWVLSAAHCFGHMTSGENKNIKIITAVTDIAGRTNDTVVTYSEQLVLHPDYTQVDGVILHDVALVRASRPFTVDGGIDADNVHLADGVFPTTRALSCVAVGFGDARRDAARLYKLRVDVTQTLRCLSWTARKMLKTRSYDLKAVGDGVLCVNAPSDTAICTGDSGGPLICQGITVGVASFNSPHKRISRSVRYATADCDSSHDSAVYTYVGPYVNWIRKHVPDLPSTFVVSRTAPWVPGPVFGLVAASSVLIGRRPWL